MPPPRSPPSPPPLPPLSPPPRLCPVAELLDCSFETDKCGWIDTANWTRTSGGTPSSYTGPSSDHTTGSGYYIYKEATSRLNKLHRLESPLFSLQQDASLFFFYHMFGSDMWMGTLSIEANNDETGWSNLWSKTGDLSAENPGRAAAVVLPASTTQVRFNGETGPGYQSDMALDDISFSQFVPPSLPPYPPAKAPIPPPPPPSPPSHPPPSLPSCPLGDVAPPTRA